MAVPRKECCDTCSHKSKNMQELNQHMKVVHKKSDHMRMERLTKTFKAVVSRASVSNKKSDKLYDCSECGYLFVTSDQFNKHIKNHNTVSNEEIELKMLQQEEKKGEETQSCYFKEVE